ncbi:hypothetical protein Bca4012_033637 [Brassica carinata]|uniref:Uncharacterized protein n=2 Tax=Brassica oleracea TaxID=3712 RepID=A0A0D3C3C7_BRAOL|nr:unnamed protein product [Brassica oleracea]
MKQVELGEIVRSRNNSISATMNIVETLEIEVLKSSKKHMIVEHLVQFHQQTLLEELVLLRTAVNYCPVRNSDTAMERDSPILAIELDVEEMAKNHKAQ